ncbi:MAG: hypothetical protein LBQ98_00365 [Nitrososphaerota archaeon]|jgi:hypothetical protein|nr:hypothetical protein [Nitrososphaerota archaeon]
MKNKTQKTISIMLALMLVVSCFAALLPTTTAAKNQYTVKHGQYFQAIINGNREYMTRFELYDNGNLVGYAYCANMDLPCYDGSTYKSAPINDYFKNDQDKQIMAALTYIANVYGWMETSDFVGYQQLIQTTLWRIIHGYEVTYIDNVNGGEIKKIIDHIYDNIDDILNDYTTGITLSGKALATPVGYGPFQVSENTILANVMFDLVFTKAPPNTAFVNPAGHEIAAIKPGEHFYIHTGDGQTGDFEFSATASTLHSIKYVIDLNFFIAINDNGDKQPLVEPLVGVGIEIKAFASSCSNFTIASGAHEFGQVYGSVTATNADNRQTILSGLNPKNGNPYYGDKNNPNTPYVVPNSNHFVYAVLDRAKLENGAVFELHMLVGNNFDVVGKASVKLVGDALVVALDGKGTFGVTAFNQIPVFNNGNVHSQKATDLAKFGAAAEFKHDNNAIISCPIDKDGNIYLYIHCDAMQFYNSNT